MQTGLSELYVQTGISLSFCQGLVAHLVIIVMLRL
jgi:hypothetical protein